MKSILITGASSGIGRALALRAARAGLCVVGIGRDTSRLSSLVSDAGTGARVYTMAADVGEAGAAKRIVAFAVEKCGGIDVLVNNAGEAAVGELIAQSDDALRRQFATHVIGPIALVREALPALKAARGHVIMLGSGVARVPVDGLGAYSPAKAAVRSATALLRRELRRYAVAVTYVDPGAVDTPFMTRAGLAGAPKAISVSPEIVARKIWTAIARRPREMNAVPWQTAAVSIGEKFPRITDAVLARASKIIGTDKRAGVVAPAPVVPSPPAPQRDSIETALEPLARRMERSGLRIQFVRDLLQPGARLELGEVAMRWAGMPNKHERALTQDVLQALAAAGYLEASGDDAWTVSGNRSTAS